MDRWVDAEPGEVHSKVFEYVRTVENAQCDIFDRFLKLACLYDPNERMGFGGSWFPGSGQEARSPRDGQVSENVCASNVDTVSAIISRTQPRARFMTDDGEWSSQRRAKQLEYYAEGLAKLADVAPKSQRGFKDAAIFGTGLVKVFTCRGEPVVERVLIDELVVDEGESKSGPPRQLHQRKLVDRGLLMAEFPDKKDEIARAQTESNGTTGAWRWWADYRPIERDQIVVIESWWLPIGKPGEEGYKPGRHSCCADGVDLFDEEWKKSFFPFAKLVWSERTTGWYGIGLLERIAGHQRALNKLNWQIDRQLDQHAFPTTWVQMGDADIAHRTVNRFGTIGVYKSALPVTVTPQAVGAEQFRRQADIKNSSYEESGVSRLSASSLKPAGLESAVSIREYKDTTTERFALQEQAYERFVLDIVWLLLDCAKDLGDDAPVVVRRSKSGLRKIKWSDVDMGDVRVQMEAASRLSRTPAGRMATVSEWAEAGIISVDEARRLLQHPDLERAMSLYTAALEDIERCIEEVLDGEFLVPEPYQNLKMGVWRFQMAYLKAKADGAPEEVCEAMRTWMVQAAHVLNPPAPPAMPGMGMVVPGVGMAPPMVPPGPAPLGPVGPMPGPAPPPVAMPGAAPPMGAPPMMS